MCVVVLVILESNGLIVFSNKLVLYLVDILVNVVVKFVSG